MSRLHADRFAYLSQPLLRKSADEVVRHWKQQQPEQQQQTPQTGTAGQASSSVKGATAAGDGSSVVANSQQRRKLANEELQRLPQPHVVSAASPDAERPTQKALTAPDRLSSFLATVQAWRRRRHRRQRPQLSPVAVKQRPYNLTDQHVQDDAFGTIMQVGLLRLQLMVVLSRAAALVAAVNVLGGGS